MHRVFRIRVCRVARISISVPRVHWLSRVHKECKESCVYNVSRVYGYMV